MRFLTCASFHGTGSSAVTDFFSEFDNIVSLNDSEYRLAWDPDGISDLEFNIVQNNIRTNMPYAIDRFIAFTKMLGSLRWYRIFGDGFQRATKQYLSDITELKAHSYWHRNRIDKGRLFYAMDRGYSFFRKKLTGGKEGSRSLLAGRKIAYFSAVSEEEFLEATRRYMDTLFGGVSKGAQILMVDQLVPPTQTGRIVRYFNDIKAIVVDRDPRDVFLFDKTRWKSHKIPTETAEDYVKWFLITRKYSSPENEDKSRILRIRFEDMIYHYEETAKKLMDFVGVEEKNHVRRRTRFNPDISIKNTQMQYRVKGYEKEIRYIEEHLKDYLYPFPEGEAPSLS